MPRDGAGIYRKPFPDVVPDTSVESTVYNGFVADVELDLNTPRPIIAGGTGTDNADDILNTIGGEKASQEVFNFDSHVWLPGSFRAAKTASGAPVADHAFSGIVYSTDRPQSPPLNQNFVVHARDLDDTIAPKRTYVRERKAGVWVTGWTSDDRTVISSGPPAGMSPGALWWDNDTGVLYVYYDDGNSKQWVQTTALNAIDTSPLLRHTRVSLAGAPPFVIPVPSTAAAVRLTGFISMTSSETQYPLLELGFAGVYPAVGKYLLSGFTHGLAPQTAVVGVSNDVSFPGMIVVPTGAGGVHVESYSQFEGALSLRRASTSKVFQGFFRGTSRDVGMLVSVGEYVNILQHDVPGELQVTSLRVSFNAATTLGADSFLTLEWL